ncbi:molybdopterin synthase catalytic subunit MoaE [Pigmentiphaga kullae]|uniref:Molybdopterin synthase catalytic subunit n=1 Tax=Pigmentiphaga kullae TaxID=151784 RepID=A0A4Q7NBU1_9BURK|nr:molybdopterin synthase catalytic subunit MoaE [Pigmentiphaga kullae]RZS80471.1 molybdopterin synthase subunit MoaE [Pigmentiphaga kullae]
MSISVQTSDFDAGAEIAALRADPSVGAVVSFVGTVRDINEGDSVSTLTLEHYPGMTEKALADIVRQARERWTLHAVRVIHRVGTLRALDQIVFVGVAGRHRGTCFAACEFIMDYLKTQAPFWKKEATGQGDRWVEARDSDDEAARRWEAGQD